MTKQNILFISASPHHAILKNRMAEELEKKGYSCYHVTASKEAYNWLRKRTRQVFYLINERNYILSKDINYYLRKIESRYGVSTKKILTGDWDHSQIKRSKAFKYMVQEFFFWEDFITKRKIDLMISEAERFLNIIPRTVLKSKKKTTFLLTASLDSDCFRITREPIHISFEIEHIMKNGKFSKKELKKAEVKIRQLKKKKEMIRIGPKTRRAFGAPRLDLYNLNYFFKRLIKQIFVEKNRNVYGNVLRISRQRIIQALRKHIAKLFYSDFDNLKKEKYFLFPFHAYIDAQILLRCPQFINQLYVIEYISRSLPAGYKLLIKEHPVFPGLVSIKDLSNIERMPNVHLIDPKIHSHEAILNSSGVIAINSTIGWEAMYHDIPAIILGKPVYSVTNIVWKVDDLFYLPETLLRSQTESRINKKELIRYVAGMERLNHKGEYLGYLTAKLAAPISLDKREKILDEQENVEHMNNIIKAIDMEIKKL